MLATTYSTSDTHAHALSLSLTGTHCVVRLSQGVVEKVHTKPWQSLWVPRVTSERETNPLPLFPM